ncbi:MAG: hypothetical protein HRT58_22335 [Crocinitomicaceae bacterium]|nr:hypothetical protein [Flavobacteriales bacterium]NQZ38416.1 hypothetical protein [Crocinitomicaceae bacterium]
MNNNYSKLKALTNQDKKSIVALAKFDFNSIGADTKCIYEHTRSPYIDKVRTTVKFNNKNYTVTGHAHYNAETGYYTSPGKGWISGVYGFDTELTDEQGRAIYEAYKSAAGRKVKLKPSPSQWRSDGEKETAGDNRAHIHNSNNDNNNSNNNNNNNNNNRVQWKK